MLSRQVRTYDHLAVARLKPGVHIEQAQAEMDTIGRRLEAEYPATNRGVRIEVLPLPEESIRVVRPTLYVMLAAVSCLLLIACLNLATLLGARAATRTCEFTVRLALGASRGRLMLQALAEVVPVLVIGGIVGVAAARAAIAAFLPIAPTGLPRVESIAVNGPVLAFSIGVLLLTGLIAGGLPAMQAWRANIATATKGSRSSTGTRDHVRTLSLLVVAQLALTLPLLVSATALVRSFAALMEVDPGFRTDNVLSMHLAISLDVQKRRTRRGVLQPRRRECRCASWSAVRRNGEPAPAVWKQPGYGVRERGRPAAFASVAHGLNSPGNSAPLVES